MSDQVSLFKLWPEIAVAATNRSPRNFVYVSNCLCVGRSDFKKEGQIKRAFPLWLTRLDIILESLASLAYKLRDKKDFYFLARGVNLCGRVKVAWKPGNCLCTCRGIAAGETETGTLALIESDTPVVAIMSIDYTYEDSMANLTGS